MSFCCGASMIGTIGAIRSDRVVVHRVPIVFCPICRSVEIHYAVREEFDLLVDYAQGDGAHHVNFDDFVDCAHVVEMMEDCVSVEEGEPEQLYRTQIDNALDLLGVAKRLGDVRWEHSLKKRLSVLSRRLQRYTQREKT